MAVDSNLPSFTDNRTGIAETQTDTMANNLPQVTYSVENESLNTPGNNYNTGAPLTQATYRLNTVTIPSSFGLGSTGSGYTIGDYLTLATIQEASATPTYGGAGYLLGDTLEVATLQFASVPANNAVVAPGTGYAVGDILDVSGGTAAYPAQLIVTGVGAKGSHHFCGTLQPRGVCRFAHQSCRHDCHNGKGRQQSHFQPYSSGDGWRSVHCRRRYRLMLLAISSN